MIGVAYRAALTATYSCINCLRSLPAPLALNQWAFGGDWAVKDEHAGADRPGATLGFRFHARDLHIVLGAAVDGKPPGDNHGVDTDAQGNGSIAGQRLYQLVRQHGPVADHLFESSSSTRARRRSHSRWGEGAGFNMGGRAARRYSRRLIWATFAAERSKTDRQQGVASGLDRAPESKVVTRQFAVGHLAVGGGERLGKIRA